MLRRFCSVDFSVRLLSGYCQRATHPRFYRNGAVRVDFLFMWPRYCQAPVRVCSTAFRQSLALRGSKSGSRGYDRPITFRKTQHKVLAIDRCELRGRLRCVGCIIFGGCAVSEAYSGEKDLRGKSRSASFLANGQQRVYLGRVGDLFFAGWPSDFDAVHFARTSQPEVEFLAALR